MTPFIIGAFFILLGFGIVWRQRKKRSSLPRATGEVYVPKRGELPGDW